MVPPQFTGIGKVKSVAKTADDALDFVCEHGRVRVAVLNDTIVRVRATQANEFRHDFSYAVARTKWPTTRVAIHNGKKVVTITTEKLVVTIIKSPLRISFATLDRPVLNRDDVRGMGWDGEKCRSCRTLARGEYSLTQFRWREGKLNVDNKKTGYKGATKKYRVRVSGT